MTEHIAFLDEAKVPRYMIVMATDSFSLLRARRKEIAAEAGDLRSRLDALDAEDKELAAAEAVLLRFGAIPEETELPREENRGKPAGTPTTPNMILALLREARGQGKPGLEPREMQISISKRWWPSVKSEDVGPTAWRMWKDGRLQKEGSVYMLPKKAEAADLLGEGATASD
jgi:hypothetical protein